jgi:UPF0716 protein FxsA
VGKWLAVFTLIPLAETFLLYVLGQHMGLWATIGVILLTGVLGAALAKREGLRVWKTWTQSLAQGRLPEEGIVGGVLVLVGGVLLVTPGVLTDLTGVALLVPPSRRFIGQHVRRYLEKRIEQGTVQYRVQVGGLGGLGGLGGFGGMGRDPDVIDAEGEVVDERRRDRRRSALED